MASPWRQQQEWGSQRAPTRLHAGRAPLHHRRRQRLSLQMGRMEQGLCRPLPFHAVPCRAVLQGLSFP